MHDALLKVAGGWNEAKGNGWQKVFSKSDVKKPKKLFYLCVRNIGTPGFSKTLHINYNELQYFRFSMPPWFSRTVPLRHESDE